MHPEHYLIEKIVAVKGNKVKLRYYGMSSAHDTWELKSSVDPQIFKKYVNKKKK